MTLYYRSKKDEMWRNEVECHPITQAYASCEYNTKTLNIVYQNPGS